MTIGETNQKRIHVKLLRGSQPQLRECTIVGNVRTCRFTVDFSSLSSAKIMNVPKLSH